MTKRSLLRLGFVIAVVAMAGCGSSAPFPIAPAAGTVTYADGSIPQGEMMTIRFEPVLSAADGNTKGPRAGVASGAIDPNDGSFEMRAGRGDVVGAAVGEHKVTFTIIEDYNKPVPDSLIPTKYTDSSTTPFTVTVPPGGKTDFKFVLDRK